MATIHVTYYSQALSGQSEFYMATGSNIIALTLQMRKLKSWLGS